MDRNLYGTLAYPWFVGTYREISIKLTARGIGARDQYFSVISRRKHLLSSVRRVSLIRGQSSIGRRESSIGRRESSIGRRESSLAPEGSLQKVPSQESVKASPQGSVTARPQGSATLRQQGSVKAREPISAPDIDTRIPTTPQTHQPVSLPQQLPIQARVAGLEVAVQLSPETTDDPGAADVLSVDARYHTWEV